MKYTVRQLAEVLHGKVEGNPDAEVTKFAKIEHGKSGDLCFYANPKYEQYVYTSKATAMLVNSDFVPREPVAVTLIRVDNAYNALAELLKFVSMQNKAYKRRRSLRSRVAFSAKLGKKVWVGDFVTIGGRTQIGECTKICDNVTIGANVKIGHHCLIYPGVHIFDGTVIGDRVILHAGCVIGDDGFGNARREDGSWEKIEHMGNVIIGNDVELGSNTCVDKAPMESTIIENGVRIDNLCQIAHNVVVGQNTAIAAQTGIAGSTEIGKNCILAGQVGIVGHIKLADNTTVGAKSGIMKSVRKQGEILFGIPALDRIHYLRSFARFKEEGK